MKKIFGFIGMLLGMFMLLSAVSPAFIACAFEDEPAETAYADIQEYEVTQNGIVETYDWFLFDYGVGPLGLISGYITFERIFDGEEYTNGDITLELDYVRTTTGGSIIESSHGSFDLSQTGTHIDGMFRVFVSYPLWWVDIPDDRWLFLDIADSLFYDGGNLDVDIRYDYNQIPLCSFEISTVDYTSFGFTDSDFHPYIYNYVWVPFEFGWESVEIVEPSPFFTLKDSVNDLLAVPILGPYLTFGTIFKLAFGILLVFICVKLFLGG